MAKKIFWRISWTWLILAPIIIAGFASWQTFEVGCEAEIQVADVKHSGRQAAWACTKIFSAPPVPIDKTTSPTDLASMRISLIGTITAIFLGLIALLAGYKAFFELEEAPAGHDGFACFCERDPGSGDLVVKMWNGGRGATSLRALRAEDALGTAIARCPDLAVRKRSACIWTVPSSAVGGSTSLTIRGALEHVGVRSTFEAEFTLTLIDVAAVRLVRNW